MPPSFSRLIPEGRDPCTQEIMESLIFELSWRAGTPKQPKEIVFAGLGEPMLRWETVKEVVTELREHHPDLLLLPSPPSPVGHSTLDSTSLSIPIRLVTNGLGPPAMMAAEDTIKTKTGRNSSNRDYSTLLLPPEVLAEDIHDLFDSVSVAINTADPKQYEKLMQPTLTGLVSKDAHGRVCAIIASCAARGLATECTVVSREDVDLEAVQELASRFGASFRGRPYFA
ncbi:unnamed protein product [Choristocarpus tenellus]